MNNKIHYGFGLEYLSNWGINEALREIYQNFLDYGHYEENVTVNGEITSVVLTNDWMPESLDFLRIGNSRKANENAIGKHGEGLKMAFLIMLRHDLQIKMYTDKYVVKPDVYSDTEIGECFCLAYEKHDNKHMFSIWFDCPTDVFTKFRSNIIEDDSVLFTHKEYGQVVDKPKGNIYSGKLFVAHANNLSKSYNINPEHLPLDRDRAVPKSFDVSWATSKINEAHGKWSANDTSCDDTMYIDKVPEKEKHKFKPQIVDNSVVFTVKDSTGEAKVLSNTNIINALKRDNFFTAAVKRLKMYIARQLGIYDMLLEFKRKHVYGVDAIADFDLILERVTHMENERITDKQNKEVPEIAG